MQITNFLHHPPVQGFQFGTSLWGKPAMYVYVYFVDGLLIDTGHSNGRKMVLSHLTKLPVEQIFITHHHEDHNGNLAALQQHFNVLTYASSLCTEIMKRPPKISFSQWLTWGNTEPNHQIEPVDTQIKTNKYTFEIVPIPGHAIDMVALYEQNEGWLFSADLYIYDYIKFCMFNESMAEQIASLKRVLALDFEYMFCAHNPKLKHPKIHLQRKLDFLENFYQTVAHWHQKGYAPKQIMDKMGLKKMYFMRFISQGFLSTLNMVKSVVRDLDRAEVAL
ncbi:MAG: MBL fold metallo-hydrolase [Bacteroidota bacterium]